MHQRTYSFSDVLLILFALLLIFGSGSIFVQNISLRHWLLGWSDESNNEPVGLLKNSEIGTLRQLGTENEFKSIQTAETLYNHDTIVTGDNGHATLHFEDGTELELGPRTMVRLDFNLGLELAGISRLSTLTVLTGEVKPIAQPSQGSRIQIKERAPPALPKAPKPVSQPNPAPIAAEPVAPAEPIAEKPTPPPAPKLPFDLKGPSQSLRVPPFTQPPKVQTALSWKAPEGASLENPLTVRTGRNLQSKPIQSYPLKGRQSGSVTITLEHPGPYTWTIEGSKETKPQTFNVEKEFRGIQVIKPLIGGNLIKSSRLKSDVVTDSFDIQLRWKSYPGAKNYNVQFYKTAKSTKPIYAKTLTTTHYQLNKNKLFVGQIFYEISTETASGFLANSGRIPFRFDYLPPVPVFPKQDISISQKRLKDEDNKVLFTWEKTNFTKNYEIQIARDEDFKNIIIKKRTQENFYIFDAPPPGVYFWRLISIGAGAESEPSAPSRFKIEGP